MFLSFLKGKFRAPHLGFIRSSSYVTEHVLAMLSLENSAVSTQQSNHLLVYEILAGTCLILAFPGGGGGGN